MARIRSIKPEFWLSEVVASWHPESRLTFIGLWTLADDNGVGLANERLIASQLYPLDDPDEAFKRTHRALTECSNGGQVVLYQVGGKRLYYLTSWDEHQKINRPSRSRFPRPSELPPDPLTSNNTLLTEHSVSPHDTHTEGSEPRARAWEQGAGSREGEDFSSTIADATDDQPSPEHSSDPEPRPDVEALCERLRDRIVANDLKAPTITETWRKEARLMLDRDGRDHAQAMRLIDWCQADPFWHANILSIPKFRKQYDQLLAKAREQHRRAGPAARSSPTGSAAEATREAFRARREAPSNVHALPYANGI